MSTVIDERVVSMQFDNRKFENNIRTSMNTLNKFKESLNFRGATKGIEDLRDSTRKLDFKDLEVCATRAGFHISDVFEKVTRFLENDIARRIVNVGKNITNTLTIEPIYTGYQEYETQIGAIQTILANTQKEGATIKDVNAALDDLNHYADLTIYNFTQMVSNIGKFTTAGVKLQTSVDAIKGIANAAALAGATASQTSNVMYQLSQALQSGKVLLRDWMSVENSGIGGVMFQDALKDTAREMGMAVDAAIEKFGSFRDSLREGWLTADVLTETLKKFTDSGAMEYVANYTGLTLEMVDAELSAVKTTDDLKNAANSLAKAAKNTGVSEEQIYNVLNLAKTATEAATKVKTFTQLFDVLKESVQSGWAETWRTIIGDFEEARDFFTSLSDMLTEALGKSSEARNDMLHDALDSKWDTLTKNLKEAGIATEDYAEAVEKIGKEYFDIDVSKIISEYGSLKKATDAGAISSDVYTMALASLVTVSDDFAGELNIVGKAVSKNGDSLDSLISRYEETYNKIKESGTENISEEFYNSTDILSDSVLKLEGYTEDEIKVLKSLSEKAAEAGKPISSLMQDMDKPSGRELLISSVKNILDSLVNTIQAVKRAWTEAFYPGMTADEILKSRSEKIYAIAKAFKELTDRFKIDEEAADKITRTFKGLFSVLELISNIFGGALKLVFSTISKVFDGLGISLLDVTAALGDALTVASAFIKAFNPIEKLAALISNAILKLIDSIKQIKVLGSSSDILKNFYENLKNFKDNMSFDNFSKVFNNIRSVGSNIIKGLIKGLTDLFPNVIDTIKNLVSTIINTVKEKLGIHSPSKVFIAIGGFIIGGLVSGLAKNSELVDKAFSSLGDAIKSIAEKKLSPEKLGIIDSIMDSMKNSVKSIANFFTTNNIISSAISIGIFSLVKDITSSLKNFSSVGLGLGTMLSNIGIGFNNISTGVNKFLKNFKGVQKALKKFIKAEAFDTYAKGVLKFAGALGILAASLAVLSLLPKESFDRIKDAGILLSLLAGMLIAVTFAMEKFSSTVSLNYKKGDGFSANLTTTVTKLVDVSSSLLILAISMKTISKIIGEGTTSDYIKLGATFGVLAAALLGMTAIFKVISKTDKFDVNGISNFSKSLSKISIALILLMIPIKVLSKMQLGEMVKATAGMALILAFIKSLETITGSRLKGSSDFGKAILQISIGLVALSTVVKILGSMDWPVFGKALVGMSLFTAFIFAMSKAMNMSKDTFVSVGNSSKEKTGGKFGSNMLAISAALIVMTTTVKILGTMDWPVFGKATVGLGIFAGFIALMSVIMGKTSAWDLYTDGNGTLVKNKGFGKALAGLAGALLLMSVSFKIMGSMKWDAFGKAAVGLALFGTFIGIFVSIFSKNSQYSKKSKDEEFYNIGKALLALSAAIGILAGVSALMGLIDTKQLIKGIAAVTVLGLMLSLPLFAMKNATGKAMGNIIALGSIIVALGAVIAGLTIIAKNRNKEMIIAATSVTTAMGSLALAIFAIGKIPTGKIGNVLKTIGILAAYMALVTGAFIAISYFANSSDSMISMAVSFSILLLAMSASLEILDGVSFSSQNVAYSLLALAGVTAILALLAGVFKIIDSFGNVTPSLEVIAKLTLALLGLSGVVGVLGLISPVAKEALIGVGILSVLILALIACAQVFVHAVENEFLRVMTGITIIGMVFNAFPDLAKHLGAGIEVLKTVTKGIGEIIGNLVGGFTSGATSGLPDAGTHLSEFAKNLEPFINVANSITESTVTGIENLKSLIRLFIAGELLELITAFVELFTGDELDIKSFGEELADFGTYLSTFAENSSKFMELSNNFTGDGSGLKAFSAFISQMVISSLIQDVFDLYGIFDSNEHKSLGDFGEEISDFFKELSKAFDPIKDFAEVVKGFGTEEGSSGIKSFSKFILDMVISSFVNRIKMFIVPFTSEEGALGDFGEDISKFFKELSKAFDPIKEFAEVVKSFGTEDSVKGLDIFSKFIQKMVVLGLIDNISDIVGKISNPVSGGGIANFGDKLEDFATDFNKFVEKMKPTMDTLSTITSDQNAITGLEKITEFIKFIQTSDIINLASQVAGSVYDFTNKSIGENIINSIVPFAKEEQQHSGLTVFGNTLSDLGDKIKYFSDRVSESSSITEKQSLIDDLIKVIKKLSEISTDESYDKIQRNAESLSEFANSIRDFSTEIIGYQTDIETSKNIVSEFLDIMSKIEGDTGANITSFFNSLKSIGGKALNKFEEGFTNPEGKNAKTVTGIITEELRKASSVKNNSDLMKEFESAGSAVADAFCGPLSSSNKNGSVQNTSPLYKVIVDNVLAAKDAIKRYTSLFTAVGVNIADAFEAGINSKISSVVAATERMALSAERAMRRVLSINSPSKVFYELGSFTCEGFISAFDDYKSDSYSSAEEIAEYAKSGLSNAIEKIQNLLSSDIDLTPVIRPVVDLSGINDGIGHINNMFGNASVSLSGVNGISASISNRGNFEGDVISALKELGTTITSTKGDTYNVNGITYDDGSNVANAVRAIVRATLMERRM